MGRTIVIADIHGNWRALKEVLHKVKPKKHDTFIFLGDYVDRLPSSALVVDEIINLRSKVYKVICMQGNHDAWMYPWLRRGILPAWNYDVKSTTDSYIKQGFIKNNDHIEFFRTLKGYYIDNQNRLFLHAGFTSHRGVEKEVHLPNFYWDRSLFESALAFKRCYDKHGEGQQHHPKRLKQYKEIYIGHTATINYIYGDLIKPPNKYKEFLGKPVTTPIVCANLYNLDTGAGFKGGKLTAMDIDTKQIWQSNLTKNLYPKYNGS